MNVARTRKIRRIRAAARRAIRVACVPVTLFARGRFGVPFTA